MKQNFPLAFSIFQECVEEAFSVERILPFPVVSFRLALDGLFPNLLLNLFTCLAF